MFREICRRIIYLYFKIVNRVEFKDIDNVPKTGPAILYANHISNADPFILACGVKRMVYFMAKQEIFKYKPIASAIYALGAFPVKRGTGDISAIKNSLERLKMGGVLCMFPEGTRKKPGKETTIKPGIAMLAIRSKCPVVPGAIIGIAKPFKKVRVIYGKPVDLSEYYDKELTNHDYIKISNDLMRESEKLMEV